MTTDKENSTQNSTNQSHPKLKQVSLKEFKHPSELGSRIIKFESGSQWTIDSYCERDEHDPTDYRVWLTSVGLSLCSISAFWSQLQEDCTTIIEDSTQAEKLAALDCYVGRRFTSLFFHPQIIECFSIDSEGGTDDIVVHIHREGNPNIKNCFLWSWVMENAVIEPTETPSISRVIQVDEFSYEFSGTPTLKEGSEGFLELREFSASRLVFIPCETDEEDVLQAFSAYYEGVHLGYVGQEYQSADSDRYLTPLTDWYACAIDGQILFRSCSMKLCTDFLLKYLIMN